MDIEDFIKQKKTLEDKKEVLEAKEKLKEEKDKVKKAPVERSSKIDFDEREIKSEPKLKPWMIWDIMVLIIIIALFVTAYFFPRYNLDPSNVEKAVGDIVDKKLEESKLTGAAVSDVNTVSQNNQQTEPDEPADEPDALVNIDKPEFEIYVEDEDLGKFDGNGKIDGKVITLSGTTVYSFKVVLVNKESKQIICKVDEKTEIDENSDGEIDDTKVKLDSQRIEIAPGDKDDVPDSVVGMGEIRGQYDARCYFCLDRFCDTYETASENPDTAKYRVRILNAAGSGNSSS